MALKDWILQNGRALAGLVVGGLLLLSMTGCAHRRAIKDGDDYAASGDWRKALVEYREAKEARPKSDKAAEKIAFARGKAVKGAIERAEVRLGKRDFDGAASDVAYVRDIDPDHERAGKIASRIRLSMADRIEAALARGDAARAYELHGTWGEIYPKKTSDRATRKQIRAVVFERTDSLADNGDYERALAELEVVAKNEPNRVAGLVRRREDYRARWADRLEAEASSYSDDDHTGAAAALWGKAYRVAGRKSDLQQFRESMSRLEDRQRLSVEVSFSGRPTRQFRSSLPRKVGGIQGADLSDEGETMVVVGVNEPQCSESVVATSQASKRYLAGTRQVENPEYNRLDDRLHDYERRMRHLKSEKRRAKHEWRHRSRDLQGFNKGRLHEQKHRLAQIEQSVRDHERDLLEFRRRLRRARGRLDRLERDDDASKGQVRQARRRVDRMEQRFSNEKRKRLEARREMRIKEDEVEKLSRRYKRLKRRAHRARKEYRRHAEDYEETHARVHRLERRLDRTPRTVTEKVYDTFRYEVSTWQQTCSRRVTLSVRSADGTAIDQVQLLQSASTTDRAHGGYQQYGVRQDPKVYTQSRRELIASADAGIENSFVPGVRRALAMVVRQRADRALAASKSNPHEATDALVGIACAAGSHLDSDRRQAINAHLQTHYSANLGALERLYGGQ